MTTDETLTTPQDALTQVADPSPDNFLAAVQAGVPGARTALFGAMRGWQRKRDAYHAAVAHRAVMYDAWFAVWLRQPDAPDYTAAHVDMICACGDFTRVDEWLLALLCAWEKSSGLPFPGVVDPESSQGASLTLERDWERELRVVRRVPPWSLSPATDQEARLLTPGEQRRGVMRVKYLQSDMSPVYEEVGG